MTKKTLKVTLLLGLVALVVLTAGVVMARTVSKDQLPEYVGSKACLGCHADKYVGWEKTAHASMVAEIKSPSSLPAPLNSASPELQTELMKATYIVGQSRFLARDPASGELKYLNVEYNAETGNYEAAKGGNSWNQSCAQCHTVGYNSSTKSYADLGIGCESCHGPGRDHILGKGDISKIVASSDVDVCAQCHTGGSMADGTKWPVGYRPGMKLSDVGFTSKTISLENGVPASSSALRIYPFWAASAHARAVEDLKANDHASGSCYKCHAQEAFTADLRGNTFEFDKTKEYDAITCTTCHSPHGSSNEAQLRLDPQALCEKCHNGSIDPNTGLKPGSSAHHPMKEFFEGYGAIGIKKTPSVHEVNNVECVKCHMAEGNHAMEVIRPDEVSGDRKDACVTCHTDSTSESRANYLEMWQNSTTTKIAAFNADVAKIDAAINAKTLTLNADLKLKYDSAKTNVSLIVADGSNGAHNFDYAMAILKDAQKSIDAVEAVMPK